MADVHDTFTRSRNMSAIRGKDTKPEIVVRKGLFRKGFRFRLHRKNLPGKPDIVLPKFNAVILVHGCFWHGHTGCPLFKWPLTRTEFWKTKIMANQHRDIQNISKLKNAGWRVLVVWECATKGSGRIPPEDLINGISNWLKSSSKTKIIEGAQAAKLDTTISSVSHKYSSSQ